MYDQAYIVFTYAISFHDSTGKVMLSPNDFSRRFGWSKRSARKAVNWLCTHHPKGKRRAYLKLHRRSPNGASVYSVSNAEWGGKPIDKPSGAQEHRCSGAPVPRGTTSGAQEHQQAAPSPPHTPPLLLGKKKKKTPIVPNGKIQKRVPRARTKAKLKILWVESAGRHGHKAATGGKQFEGLADDYLKGRHDCAVALWAMRRLLREGFDGFYRQKLGEKWFKLFWFFRKRHSKTGEPVDRPQEILDGGIVAVPVEIEKRTNADGPRGPIDANGLDLDGRRWNRIGEEMCPLHKYSFLDINRRCMQPGCEKKPEELCQTKA